MKLFKAIIWDADSNVPGKRVSILANSLGEAKSGIEAEYGAGRVYTLQSEEDANQVRSTSHGKDLLASGPPER